MARLVSILLTSKRSINQTLHDQATSHLSGPRKFTSCQCKIARSSRVLAGHASYRYVERQELADAEYFAHPCTNGSERIQYSWCSTCVWIVLRLAQASASFREYCLVSAPGILYDPRERARSSASMQSIDMRPRMDQSGSWRRLSQSYSGLHLHPQPG